MIKRNHMSLAVKLEACLNALGIDPCDVEWDHQPALALRGWDDKAQDTVPPQNDPHYIVPLSKADHKAKTNGTPSTSYGSDKHAIAKVRRIRKGKTPKGNLKSRGFDKSITKGFDGKVRKK